MGWPDQYFPNEVIKCECNVSIVPIKHYRISAWRLAFLGAQNTEATAEKLLEFTRKNVFLNYVLVKKEEK
jgi:hypothetical protein